MSGANEEVNEILAAVLSFLIVGVGHIVINGQTKRGAIWLGGTFVCGFILGVLAIFTLGLSLLLLPLFPIASAIDAYLQAQKINSGEITV
jgi:TM2 domain-containing membrane protein YozV